jgi:hypothetical protein
VTTGVTPPRPSAARRPGFRFSQGQLCITTTQEEMRLGTWPLLEATRRRKGETKWNRFVPAFRLLRPKHDLLAIEAGPAGVRGQGVDPLLEKHQAFRLFRLSLPPRLALAAERYPARQWAVLRMVQEREEAVELLEQSPALGFCTANLARFRALFGNLGKQAAELSCQPQRDILGWLGFPDTQAWVNVFRKILPETVTVGRVQMLRDVARDQDMAKRLTHVPTINTGVLELACQPQLLGLVTPALLAEIASSEEERLHGAAAHLLADLVDTLRRMNERPRFGGIRTLAGLHERGQAINAAYQRHMLMREQVWSTLKFPPPPVPGTNDIVPLTEPRQLGEESREQRNCVGNYCERVAAGKVFIYRVLQPERATLSLAPAANGEWEIDQLLRACNQPASPMTLQTVQAWLARESVSI